MLNGSANIGKKIVNSVGKLGAKIGLSVLMDQRTADLLTDVLGKGKTLRFHENEIQFLDIQLKTMISSVFKPKLELDRLEDKDQGTSLVSKLNLSEDIKTNLLKKHDLASDSTFYLLLKKVLKKGDSSKDLPPILQFLEKPFSIRCEIIFVDKGAYSSYNRSTSIGKLDCTGEFVCFVDFLGRGNRTLANINGYLKNERHSTLTNESYINTNTSKKLMNEIRKFIDPKSSNSLFNIRNITSNSSHGSFELYNIMKEVKNKISNKTREPINSLLSELLKDINKFLTGSNNQVTNVSLRAEIFSGDVLSFNFMTKNIINGFQPKNTLLFDLSDGSSKFIYEDDSRKKHSETLSTNNDYNNLFQKIIDGETKESDANKKFIEIIVESIDKFIQKNLEIGNYLKLAFVKI